MKSVPATRIAAACAFIAIALPAQKKRLTVEEALSPGGVRYYTDPTPAAWAPDGTHYVVRRGDKLMLVHPESGDGTVAPAGTTPPASPGRRRRPAKPPSPIKIFDGDLYLGDPSESDRKKLTRLTTDGGPRREAHLSPDRKRASFVRGTNLTILDLDSKEEWKVSTDGNQNLMYGVLDWVYQEEIYGRGDFQAHWWSGDGMAVAFLRLDESKVKDFTVIDHVPQDALTKERAVVPEIYKYPKAGDPNPTAALMVAWPTEKKTVKIDLGDYDDDILIVRVGWTPDSSKVLVAVQDRIQDLARPSDRRPRDRRGHQGPARDLEDLDQPLAVSPLSRGRNVLVAQRAHWLSAHLPLQRPTRTARSPRATGRCARSCGSANSTAARGCGSPQPRTAPSTTTCIASASTDRTSRV